MDTVLLILGVLGSGAVVIAAYVFMVAARNYVSETDTKGQLSTATSAGRPFVERSPGDRRQQKRFDFPMTVNGMLIPIERRLMQDRRIHTA